MRYIAEYLFNILLLITLIWINMSFVIFVHEMGHAIMYRIFFREKDWHITIGEGRTIIKFKKLTVKVFPIIGHFNIISEHKGSKLQYNMMHIGGALANALFVVLLLFLLKIIKANELTIVQRNLVWFLDFALKMNVYQFISAIIPMKYSFFPYKGQISDGMRILNTLKESNKN